MTENESTDFDAAFDALIGEDTEAIAAQCRLEEQLQAFGTRLSILAKEQVRKKTDIENRWLEDLRHYHGKLSAEESAQAKAAKRSTVTVNITRHKTNTAEARFIDMMFPADDKNWGISPTPKPDIDDASMQQMQLQIMQSGQAPTPEMMEALKAESVERAADACKRMERKIDDQLVESDFAAKCRVMIHDAVTIGTGILKAPTVDGRISKRWTKQDGVSVLTIEQTIDAGVEVVSPWDFFPDMSARSIKECEFIFERKFLTKKQVRDLMLMPNVLVEQVEKVLEEGASLVAQDDRFADVRNISGDSINTTRTRFELWEYTGVIEPEELEAVGVEAEKSDVITGTVLLLNGRVIRASLNPLDTDDYPYSVFNWEKDSNNIFGYGVPYMIRSPQEILNAAMRMMMDNGGLSVGGQFVVNRRVLTPADGNYEITPKKLWFVNDETIPAAAAMNVFNIPSNQQELANIYAMGRALIDEQASLPAVATGEGDPSASPQTATGVAIQSGSAKIVFKRAVKNFDDDVIVPVIKRFYDWNMQYDPDESIKGDFKVHAKGSTTLLVREQEAKSLTELLGLTTHPVFSVMIKPDELLREILKSRQINGSTILLTADEIKAKMEERQSQQSQQQNPEMMKLQMQMQIEQAKLQMKEMELQQDLQRMQMEAQQKEQQLALQYEIEMSKLAAQQQTTVEKLKQQAGAINAQMMIEQMRLQNQQESERARLDTQRQIAALKAQQERNKQMMQGANLQAGYDTF